MRYTGMLASRFFLFIVLCLSFTKCNTCSCPVYFQVAGASQESTIVLDLDEGEFTETFKISKGTVDPKKPMKLKGGYCTSDSLIKVKYTLNGQDTAFVVNRNQVKGCFLGDKVNKKPGVFFEPRKSDSPK